MALDHSLIGRAGEPVEQSWTSTDALLYALGVGAGQEDPLAELQLTTENSQDITQQAVPSYAVVIAQNAGRRGGGRRLGDFDPAMLVHAEQSVLLHRPLPVEGTATVSSTVTGIYDKGSGALIATEARAYAGDGEPLATSTASVFIRGEGGFGGDRGPAASWQRPDRDPDHAVVAAARRDQALLYRLCGDRNPLHSDPKFAARAGFPAPILHGMCTYGITCRLLVAATCGGDPSRFRAMSGRFSKPVFPGDILTVTIWLDGDAGRFQTTRQDGVVVLDHGTYELRS